MLRDLVVICNSGDLQMFEVFVASRRDQLEREGLIDQLKIIELKITIFALLELAFVKPQKNRMLTFDEIIEGCQVRPEDVEFLVMKAMSHGLMKGSIDQVDRVVKFTSLQPRLLDENK